MAEQSDDRLRIWNVSFRCAYVDGNNLWALLRQNLPEAGKECSQLVKSKASRKVRKKIM